MRATRRAVAGAAVLAAALLPLPVAAVAAPSGTRAPAAVMGDPVGGPALGSAGIILKPGPGTQRLPAIDADAWVLADITTGEVLAAKAPHKKVLPASTLKTLTAVTLMPVLPKDQVVTISDAVTHADGSHVGLVSGATYTVWDLWHGLLLPSGNDAAAALAEANGGMTPTVRAMQAKAIELGALDTSVHNDSGLDNPRQFTSAYDMALFARAALSNPDFATVTKTISYDFPGKGVAPGARRSTYKIYTQNRLLLHDFPGTVGGKTGFTSLAHRTFWGAAERGGHTLVVTIFQVRQPTEQAAKALLTWGFANRTKVTPVGTLVAPTEPSADPSTSASPVAAAGAGPEGTSAIGAGSTAVSLGSTARMLLVPLLVVVVIAAIVWWLLRRRGRNDSVGPVLLTAPAPDSTPVVVLPVVSPDDTAPVPVIRSGTPPPAQPVAPVAPSEAADAPDAEPAPAEPSPSPAPQPRPRPEPGGNVRIVRPGGDTTR
ncbi:MAG TPA: hypothetical protein VFL59_03590 [Candidatus Nanopelagicales bacterium]|nr:hypothetical protein [Candidatus Nanopelagicales bacterium]